jgi:hypothetical protein
MLLGTEVFYKIREKGKINLLDGNLVLQNTALGWIFGGLLNNRAKRNVSNNVISACTIASAEEENLNESLTKFWRLEEVATRKILTYEERLCEELYQNSASRTKTGRYEVDLPIDVCKVQSLGNSYGHAYKCFRSLERRFHRDPKFYENYSKFIDEFIALGHAHEVKNFPSHDLQYYLPHHAVMKESSSTTKLRVVFNGSAKTQDG